MFMYVCEEKQRQRKRKKRQRKTERERKRIKTNKGRDHTCLLISQITTTVKAGSMPKLEARKSS